MAQEGVFLSTQVRDPDFTPGSWFQPTPPVSGVSDINQQRGDFFLFVCHSNNNSRKQEIASEHVSEGCSECSTQQQTCHFLTSTKNIF